MQEKGKVGSVYSSVGRILKPGESYVCMYVYMDVRGNEAVCVCVCGLVPIYLCMLESKVGKKGRREGKPSYDFRTG